MRRRIGLDVILRLAAAAGALVFVMLTADPAAAGGGIHARSCATIACY